MGLTERNFGITGVLAVLPVDAFTCRPVRSGDFAVEVAGGGRPARKAEGFYVFSGVLPERGPQGMAGVESDLCISLWGGGYQRKELRIPISSVSPRNPLVTVRMEPGRDYPFPPGTVFLAGNLAANTSLLAAAGKQGGGLSLTADCSAGDETLSIYRERGQDLSGSRFYVTDRETGAEEWISPGMPTESDGGAYRMHSAVSGSFSKAKARLLFAFEKCASERPEPYFMAFPISGTMDEKENIDIICRVIKNKNVEKYKFHTRPGEIVEQDF